MKKILSFIVLSFLVFSATIASAASLNGISGNTTLQNYDYGSKVVLKVKNDNSYETISIIQPQKLISGKWTDLDWYDTTILNTNQTSSHTFTTGSGKDFTSKGTYRFEIETIKNNGSDIGKFVTSNFYIK